jgi:hypothetical protein
MAVRVAATSRSDLTEHDVSESRHPSLSFGIMLREYSAKRLVLLSRGHLSAAENPTIQRISTTIIFYSTLV